jgi:hypothetical protein
VNLGRAIEPGDRSLTPGGFADYTCPSMGNRRTMEYKRNQIEEAIFRTFGAGEERRNELKFRIKRLLVTDRRLGRNVKSAKDEDQHYAFFGQKPPGSGHEVMFTAYQAFALLAAVMLLEHGLPQASVVGVMRRVRRQFEAAHGDIMRKDPRTLFDQQAILTQARPGMIATNNTDPVFLVFVRLTASSVDEQDGGSAVAVCRGPAQLQAFIKRHSVPGTGATFFEFVSLMHELAAHLSQTRPVKRGRAAA